MDTPPVYAEFTGRQLRVLFGHLTCHDLEESVRKAEEPQRQIPCHNSFFCWRVELSHFPERICTFKSHELQSSGCARAASTTSTDSILNTKALLCESDSIEQFAPSFGMATIEDSQSLPAWTCLNPSKAVCKP